MGTAFGREELGSSDITGIVLSGTFPEDEEIERVYCDDLKGQLNRVLFAERENSLINENYHFRTDGAFPYSKGVYQSLQTLMFSGIRGWMTGGPDYITRAVLKIGEEALEREQISQEDYDYLQDLGKKIETTKF